MGEGVKSKRAPLTSSVFILFLAVFFCNLIIFLNTNKNSRPLIDSLFNMIIDLFIFFLSFHKEELKEEKKELLKKIIILI